MDIREHDSFPRAPEDVSHAAHALGIITAIVVVAGFVMVAAWFALLLLDERRTAPVERAAVDARRPGEGDQRTGRAGLFASRKNAEPRPASSASTVKPAR